MANNTFQFDIPTNIIPTQFTGESTLDVKMESADADVPVTLEGVSGVKTTYGNTARDLLLKFQLDHETGRYLTLRNGVNGVILSLVAKAGEVLSSVNLKNELPDLTGVKDKYLYVDTLGNLTWKEGSSSGGDVRILYDTEAGWNSHPEIRSEINTLYVYVNKDYYIHDGQITYVPGLKIGDGNAYLIDKPFIDDVIKYTLAQHMNDTLVHIQPGEREKWNNKLNYIDPEATLYPDLLEFTRD